MFARWDQFGIRPGDEVLDIGCGDRPYHLATVWADIRTPRWQRRRSLAAAARPPFVRCSVEALPFRDGAFDFVYCSHVLEHVRRPDVACRELARVARRGYLECPQSWVEFCFSSPDHRWLVDLEGGVLIFREILRAERRDFFGIRYKIFDWLRDPVFAAYWNRRRNRRARNVEFMWTGQIRVIVLRQAQRRGWASAPAGAATLPRACTARAVVNDGEPQ